MLLPLLIGDYHRSSATRNTLSNPQQYLMRNKFSFLTSPIHKPGGGISADKPLVPQRPHDQGRAVGCTAWDGAVGPQKDVDAQGLEAQACHNYTCPGSLSWQPWGKKNQLRSPPSLHSLPYPSPGLFPLQSLHGARLHRLNSPIRREKVLHKSYSGEIIHLLEKLLPRMQAISGGRARELLVPAQRAPAGFSPKRSSPSSPSAKAL